MIAAVIALSSLLTGAVVALFYEYRQRSYTESLLKEAVTARDRLLEERMQLQLAMANRDGVEAGHEADTLYRGFLNQFSQGEQVTAMYCVKTGDYYSKN